MEIKIHTHNVNLGDDQMEAIRKKFEKLSHFSDRIADESSEIRVELSRESSQKKDDTYTCVLTLFIPKDTLRVESHDASLETTIDEVLEKIKGPIERYKDKMHHISDRK